jgi:hypothetical protein
MAKAKRPEMSKAEQKEAMRLLDALEPGFYTVSALTFNTHPDRRSSHIFDAEHWVVGTTVKVARFERKNPSDNLTTVEVFFYGGDARGNRMSALQYYRNENGEVTIHFVTERFVALAASMTKDVSTTGEFLFLNNLTEDWKLRAVVALLIESGKITQSDLWEAGEEANRALDDRVRSEGYLEQAQRVQAFKCRHGLHAL